MAEVKQNKMPLSYDPMQCASAVQAGVLLASSDPEANSLSPHPPPPPFFRFGYLYERSRRGKEGRREGRRVWPRATIFESHAITT